MIPKMKKIAYYITPHGFGHAVRSLEVIRHLLEQEPELEIVLVSDIPEFLVEQNVGRALPFRRKRLDIGLVQKDSLRFDLEATLKAWEALYHQKETLVTEEVRFFEKEHIRGIVCDIPFLPFIAASRYGIPSVGMSNLTWDWIYEAYGRSDARWNPLVSWIREAYRHCGLFLQLPMHGDCSACPRIRDVPLVARKAKRRPEETRRILGMTPQQKLYLISFADLHLDEKAQKRLEKIPRTTFLYQKPLIFNLANGISLDGFELSYPDVVAAVDGVITKPGYGITADCLAHGTPIIYTDRGFFPEYEILVQDMTVHLNTVYLPSQELYAGNWEEAIQTLDALPRRFVNVPDEGAEVCARAILAQLT